MFVIIFNRDMTPEHWNVVGPFSTKQSAGQWAKANYKTHGKWIVHPMTEPQEA